MKYQFIPEVKEEKGINTFTIISYNILAESNLINLRIKKKMENIGKISGKERANIIMDSIMMLDSDIICLQEVDEEYSSIFVINEYDVFLK